MNNIIPSLHKALQLIHQLSEKNYTQVELSKELKITMSTTYRILCTLLAEGWVIKKKDRFYKALRANLSFKTHKKEAAAFCNSPCFFCKFVIL